MRSPSRPSLSPLPLIGWAMLSLAPSLDAEEAAPRTNRATTEITSSRDRHFDGFSGRTVRNREMASSMVKLRQPNAPRPGEVAPSFRLYSLTRNREVDLRALHRDKPVVLYFASWGCDIFRESLAGVMELHFRYQAEVDFVLVYIREAHPRGGFGESLGRVADPRTNEERRRIARRCREQLRLPFEVLVDDIDDPVATRWAGWPVRIFVIGTNGRVAYAGAQGPWGYRPYRGYIHGDGDRVGWDLHFSEGSLEEYLERSYPKSDS